MEARAPYAAGPRNLAPHVAAALRRLGFTAREGEYLDLSTVEAHWLAPCGATFYADYEWTRVPRPEAVLRLSVYEPGATSATLLIRGQHISRLQEVRLLVLRNHRFSESRRRLPALSPTP